MGSYAYPTGIPSILTEHEVRADAAHTVDGRRWKQYQINTWKRFDRIQTFTSRDADAIRAMAPALADRVRVNPYGVNVPPMADLGRERRNTVVFVGGFLHPPNVDAAVWLGNTIMPLLREQAPGTRLIIVGSDPPRAVRKLTCSDITVTGRVPDVKPFLEQAAVVLAPLRTGGGMRLKVLQAMAAGKPVVTTAFGAEGLARHGAVPLLVADEAAEFARATAALLAEDEGTRRALLAPARLDERKLLNRLADVMSWKKAEVVS